MGRDGSEHQDRLPVTLGTTALHRDGRQISSPSSSSSTLMSESIGEKGKDVANTVGVREKDYAANAPREQNELADDRTIIPSDDEHVDTSDLTPAEALETSNGDDRVITASEVGDEVEMIDGRPRDVYDRFTRSQKRRILAIVSYSAIIAPMASSIFYPAIPQLSVDLHESTAVINYTVAVFLVVIAIAPVLWSPYAGFYGRKPIYLSSMPIMVVASIGVAVCNNVGALIGTRILQGIGSSCFLSVGAGTVGDIYRPTERSRGMSAFYAGVMFGPAISPALAGILVEYTPAGWRSTQYFLAGMGALSIFLVYFFMPETSHPPLPHDVMKAKTGKKFVPFYFNPFSSLGLVRWPNIALACLISSAFMLIQYMFIVPLSAVFKERYNIDNLAISGCLYLASGLGNIVGTKISGPWGDRTVAKYIAKRGFRRPEDRLRASFIGACVIMPPACFAYGWLLQTNAGGIAPPLVMLFFNGLALMIVLSPVNTYLVDSMQGRSSEVIAVNNCIRYLFAAVASAVVIPIADAIGWGWTMTIAGFVAVISALAIIALYRYGDVWREKANVRYGITTKAADEIHVDKGKDEEVVIGTESQSQSQVGPSRRGSEEEKHEQIGSLPPPASMPRTLSRKNSGKATYGQGQGLSRQNTNTRGEMPKLEAVLSRTISLSGASVHGGG